MDREISKHDPHAEDGQMSRLTFSRVMSGLDEYIYEQYEAVSEEDSEMERMIKKAKNELIGKISDHIEHVHDYYLYDEPREWDDDPQMAELAEIPGTKEELEDWKKHMELRDSLHGEGRKRLIAAAEEKIKRNEEWQKQFSIE